MNYKFILKICFGDLKIKIMYFQYFVFCIFFMWKFFDFEIELLVIKLLIEMIYFFFIWIVMYIVRFLLQNLVVVDFDYVQFDFFIVCFVI